MIKTFVASVFIRLLKRTLGPIFTMVLKTINPVEIADALGPTLRKQMAKVPASVQDSIVLALEKLYLFAKELQDEIKTKGARS